LTQINRCCAARASCNAARANRAASHVLETLARNQHDASHRRVIAEPAGRGDIPMLERAISFQHPRIAVDDGAIAEPTPAGARIALRAFRDQAAREMKRALQFLGRLAEAGGPLS